MTENKVVVEQEICTGCGYTRYPTDGFISCCPERKMIPISQMFSEWCEATRALEASQAGEAVALATLREIAAADPGPASNQSLAHEMAAMARQALTPPQAADSGLLEEAIGLLRRIHPDPDYETEQQYYAFPAKAGKPGGGG